MEQENGNSSVQNFEKNLGGNVMAIRALLDGHEKTIASIHRDYETERQQAESKYTKSLNETETQYRNDVNDTNTSYLSRVNAVEGQFVSKRNEQMDNTKSVRERNENMINDLLRRKQEWQRYISIVHQDFETNVDDAKKAGTAKIREKWEELVNRKDQSTLGKKGHVKYDRTSPFLYALFHPFSNVPKWLPGLRTAAIIIAMIWIAILIGMCMRDAYWHQDISSVLASNDVRYLFFGTLGYFAIAFICCFISAIVLVAKENKAKRNHSEDINDHILSEKADAAAQLVDFERRYKPVYFHDGRWDWDWRRYPMTRAEADALMEVTQIQNNNYRPSASAGIGEYKFVINYDAL